MFRKLQQAILTCALLKVHGCWSNCNLHVIEMFSTSNGVRDTYSTVRVIIIKENEYVQLCFWSVDGKGKKGRNERNHFTRWFMKLHHPSCAPTSLLRILCFLLKILFWVHHSFLELMKYIFEYILSGFNIHNSWIDSLG